MSTNPESPASQDLPLEFETLRGLIEAPLENRLSDPGACLEHVLAVQEAYRRLDRPALGADRVLELKFAALHWRRALMIRLRDEPPPWLGTDHNTLTAVVAALGARLPGSLLTSLSRRVRQQDVRYLMALQGDPVGDDDPALARLAGPARVLNIRANRSSAWPFARWKRRPEFGRYEFSGGGVRFRGVHFLPGDILLANVNIDGNGVYTTLSDPTRFSSHAAVFAILEDGDGRYPAVIETYENGVRAVPLNVFLGPAFSAYVEVYRHDELDERRASLVNRSALALIDSVQGYNFDSSADDRQYVSCCGVGRLLLGDAGVAPPAAKSRIQHPRIQANLKVLGYEYFDFFAPVDYLLDTRFRCVGWVDNAQFESLLARELVEGYFRELFMSRRLNPARFPFMARINRWGIGHIRRRTILGRLIGRLEGFDHRSLPRGPDPLLAVITLVEAQIGRMVARTRHWLAEADDVPPYFSLEEFARRTDVRSHLESHVRFAWLD